MDDYVKLRIQEIPIEIKQSFLKTKQVWKCEGEFDFLYGYYVGKIEEGALHYLQKATRAQAGSYADLFEIRGVIEAHRNDLRDAIKRCAHLSFKVSFFKNSSITF